MGHLTSRLTSSQSVDGATVMALLEGRQGWGRPLSAATKSGGVQ